jgi:hypothetical protein
MAQIGVVTKVETVPAARDERMLTRLGLVLSCTIFASALSSTLIAELVHTIKFRQSRFRLLINSEIYPPCRKIPQQ